MQKAFVHLPCTTISVAVMAAATAVTAAVHVPLEPPARRRNNADGEFV